MSNASLNDLLNLSRPGMFPTRRAAVKRIGELLLPVGFIWAIILMVVWFL
jgi:hypothetical protein